MYRCSCGFAGHDRIEYEDHLRVAFLSPSNDIGNDGRSHAEIDGPAPYNCMCGVTAQSRAEFDDHWLARNIPPGRVGAAGIRHEPVGEQAAGLEHVRHQAELARDRCRRLLPGDQDVPALFDASFSAWHRNTS